MVGTFLAYRGGNPWLFFCLIVLSALYVLLEIVARTSFPKRLVLAPLSQHVFGESAQIEPRAAKMGPKAAQMEPRAAEICTRAY